MRKQSGHGNNGGGQLEFDLAVDSKGDAAPAPASAQGGAQTSTSGVVISLVSILERRAAERDWALLNAVQARAAHLEDCLLKRR